MSQSVKALFQQLRLEMEKKHQEERDQLAALEARMLAGAAIAAGKASEPTDAAAGIQPTSQVEMVLNAIRDEYKTVEQIAAEVPLSEEKVRAVLYSRFVKDRIAKARIAKKMMFKLDAEAIPGHVQSRQATGPSITSRVYDLIKSTPTGLTCRQIVDSLGRTPQMPKTVGTALYHLKQRGDVIHNAETGVYILNNTRNGQG